MSAIAKSHPLFASQEKINRAKRKLVELERVVTRYRETDSHSIIIKRQPKALYIIAHRNNDVDADVAFEIVEIAAQLRSALNKITLELAHKNGHTISTCDFPFGSIDRNTGNPNPFPDGRMLDIKHGIKKRFTTDQWDLIVAQKPYPGGDDTLWAINEIANADKHRRGLVTAVPSVSGNLGLNPKPTPIVLPGLPRPTAINMFSFTINGAAKFAPDVNTVLDNHETDTLLFTIEPPATHFDIKPALTINIVFGDISPISGKDVIETTAAQISLVDQILHNFRAAFF